MDNEQQQTEEINGIRFYPPLSPLNSHNGPLKASKIANRQPKNQAEITSGQIPMRETRSVVARAKMQSINLEESDESEGDEHIICEETEKMDTELLPEVDYHLFRELVAELDDGIECCMSEFYNNTIGDFEKLLATPCASDDLVPTLFVRGNCLDWERLFRQLKSQHPQLIIENGLSPFCHKSTKDAELQITVDLNETRMLLVILQVDFATKTEMLTRIFNCIENRGFIFVVVCTQTTFATIEERLPRTIFARLHISYTHLPPTEKFLNYLFSLQFPLGILRKSTVQFHGKALIAAQRFFQRESRSLSNVRKALTLALLEYAAENGKGRRTKKSERSNFSHSELVLYDAALDLFIRLIEGSGKSDKFELHCRIQSEANFFSAFYREQKDKWNLWPGDVWRTKFKALNAQIGRNFIFKQYKKNCEEIASKLEESNRLGNEENLLNATLQKGQPTSTTTRRSLIAKRTAPKSAQFLHKQQHLRSRLTNPLPDKFRSQLFNLLDSIFLENLHQFPIKFVAGPGAIHLLGSSLSTKVDHELGDLSKQQSVTRGSQLDVQLVYQLLVTQNTDSYSLKLADLECNFCQLVSNVDGLEPEARFMVAITQLEHIGAIKYMAEGIVRLIYLPGATLTKNLFEKEASS